jgi:hypothetical protein
MATKKAASPGISGAVSDAVDAVKSYVGVGRRDVSGNKDEQSQLDESDKSESEQASNAGRQAQSTDHMNQY